MTTNFSTTTTTIFSFFEGKTLTESQRRVLYALETFMLEGEEEVFILKGFAGTGKTWLMAGVAEWLETLGGRVAFATPTGRAAKVLANKTGKTARTLHRLIYKQESKVDNLTSFKLEDRDLLGKMPFVVVVDEASMVGNDVDELDYIQSGKKYGTGKVLQDLIEYINFRKYPKSKLIFVGDGAQLAPIGSTRPYALSVKYLWEQFSLRAVSEQMTDIVRQDTEGGIVQNASYLRQVMHDGSYIMLEQPAIKYGSDVVLLKDTDAMLDQYFALCEQGSPNAGVIMLSHTNSWVKELNNRVHDRFFPGMRGKVCVGDVLVVGRNIYTPEINLLNGEIVRVASVGPVFQERVERKLKEVWNQKSNYFKHSEVEGTVTGTFPLQEITVEVRRASGTIDEVDVLILADWMTNPATDLTWTDQYLLESVSGTRFYEENKELYRRDRKTYDERKAEFVSTSREANVMLCNYAYAMTAHKAQGGEWPHAIVDMNPSILKQSKEYYRWAYTALTRAKSKVYLSW